MTITRLRRIASRMHGVDAELDAKSLAEVIGPTSDITSDILEMATTSGTGLSKHEVSGAIGLGYAIHLFGGDVNSTLKAVRGGTQQISKAVAEAIDPERLMLECKVESVTAAGGGVKVRYRRGQGEPDEVEASVCISAMTADAVLESMPDLPETKREALESVLPYAQVVTVAWLTDEAGPMPWDRPLARPAIRPSFELLSNNAFLVRPGNTAPRQGRRPVCPAPGPRAEGPGA